MAGAGRFISSREAFFRRVGNGDRVAAFAAETPAADVSVGELTLFT